MNKDIYEGWGDFGRAIIGSLGGVGMPDTRSNLLAQLGWVASDISVGTIGGPVTKATCKHDLYHGGPTTLTRYATGRAVLTCATTGKIVRIWNVAKATSSSLAEG